MATQPGGTSCHVPVVMFLPFCLSHLFMGPGAPAGWDIQSVLFMPCLDLVSNYVSWPCAVSGVIGLLPCCLICTRRHSASRMTDCACELAFPEKREEDRFKVSWLGFTPETVSWHGMLACKLYPCAGVEHTQGGLVSGRSLSRVEAGVQVACVAFQGLNTCESQRPRVQMRPCVPCLHSRPC